MDFAKRQPKIDPNATAWTDDVVIGGIKSGLTLEVRSADHPELERVAHRLSGRSVRQGLLMKGKSEEEQDELIGRTMGESTLEQAIGVTVGWKWGEDQNGEPFTFDGEVWDFSPENVRKLFKILPEAVEAANAKASETANFTKASRKPSRKQSA